MRVLLALMLMIAAVLATALLLSGRSSTSSKEQEHWPAARVCKMVNLPRIFDQLRDVYVYARSGGEGPAKPRLPKELRNFARSVFGEEGVPDEYLRCPSDVGSGNVICSYTLSAHAALALQVMRHPERREANEAVSWMMAIWDSEPRHQGRRNVITWGGQVLTLPESEFQRRLVSDSVRAAEVAGNVPELSGEFLPDMGR